MTTTKTIKFYNEWAREFTKKTWNMELNIPIVQSHGRAKYYGAFMRKPVFDHVRKGEVKILLSYHLIDNHEKMIDTLKHELCHWYCYITGKQFNDGDIDFENELLKVDACSTHSGSNDKDFSKFIQKSIVTQQTTRHGFVGTEYKRVDNSKSKEILLNENHPLKWVVDKGYLDSTQDVYYKGTYIGTVAKCIDNDWIIIKTKVTSEEEIRRYGFKTRKKATERLLKENYSLIK